MSFFDRLVEESKPDSQGGKVGQIELQFGYKIFIKGMANEDSFFGYDIDDDKDRTKALEAAREAIAENGGNPKDIWPSKALQIVLFKDRVLVSDVSHWQGDQSYVYPTWVDDFKNSGGVLDKLKIASSQAEIDEELMGKHWARISWMPNLSDPQRMRSDEKEKPELFAFVAEFYPTKVAAKEAAQAIVDGKSEDGEDVSDVPTGMTKQAWTANRDDIVKQLKDDPLPTVAEDWGITEDWLRDYCVENDIDFEAK